MSAGAFVGRAHELSEVAAMVLGSRLTALTGPSGIGKTRIAVEVGARVAPGFPGGACFVELAALTDPALVPHAIAGALSLWEQPGRSVMDTLTSYLHGRRVLLILDNCEHLIQACADIAATVLEACPGVTLLATSQEALGIGGERVWRVPPLSVPDTAALPEELAESDAVVLFTQRAAAIRPGFVLTGDIVPVVAEICRRLDGIPLCIELAAARIAMLAPREIRARLDRRFTLLTQGSRVVLPRHQTLRTAIDWSHDLLSVAEQQLLYRLSIFAGGCTLDAIEAVCGDAGHERQVLASLAGLVAKSLVIADTSGSAARYRMLETLRLYAAERLDQSGETARLRARHADWCLLLAEGAEPHVTAKDQLLWLERLEADHDNLRASLTWSVDQRDAERALRIAGALTVFWRVRCHWREGETWLATALELDDGRLSAWRVRALWGAGFMALMLWDVEASRRLLEECLAGARGLADSGCEARTLLLLGNVALYRRDRGAALGLLTQSAGIARGHDDPWCLAHSLSLIGRVHQLNGDSGRALAPLEECLAVSRSTADPQSLRIGLTISAMVALSRGDYGRAEALLDEALEVCRQLGEPYFIAVTVASQGELAARRGDYRWSRQLVERAHALNCDGGVPAYISDTLCRLADIAREEGDFLAAVDLFSQAKAMFAHGAAVQGLADVALLAGRWQDAGALLDESLRLCPPDDPSWRAAVTAGLGTLARHEGELHRAATLHGTSLELRQADGQLPAVARCLEDIAGVLAEAGELARAARLFGAADAVRAANGYARAPSRRAGYDADLSTVRRGLSAECWDDARAEGAMLPFDEAVADALRGFGPRPRRLTTGWASLTRAERRVAALVAEGLTNAEIGARLGIAPRTVEIHLTHTFAKVRVTSRRELSRELARRTAVGGRAPD